jgi:hypothetical protein
MLQSSRNVIEIVVEIYVNISTVAQTTYSCFLDLQSGGVDIIP